MGELLRPKEKVKIVNVQTRKGKDSSRGFCLSYKVAMNQLIEVSQFNGVPNVKCPLFSQLLLSISLCLNSLMVGEKISKLHGLFKLLKLIQSSIKPYSALLIPPSHSTDLNRGSQGLLVNWRTWSSISVHIGVD